ESQREDIGLLYLPRGQHPHAGDYGNEITLDSAGSAYITGQTGSPDFPITPDAFQATYGGGSSDAYVAKLTPDGSGLVFSSFLGGKGDEIAFGIGRDLCGNVYVAGTTNASNLPTVNPLQATLGGAYDAFVAKVGEAGGSNQPPVVGAISA